MSDELITKGTIMEEEHKLVEVHHIVDLDQGIDDWCYECVCGEKAVPMITRDLAEAAHMRHQLIMAKLKEM
jgi:hypothetical protein